MSITITKSRYNSETNKYNKETSEGFAGRVVRIMQRSEYRNLSDTLDYSDFQTITATYALVWLGTHGLAGRRERGYVGDLPRVDHDSQFRISCGDAARDLAAHEQFGWIDCTNAFVWRGCDELVPRVDEVLDAGAVAALPVWEAEQKRLDDERLAQIAADKVRREAEAAAEAAKKAAREAKKAAKLEASKAAADADYVMVAPMKGSIVTVAGFTGTLFWIGVKEYRGQYGVRIGVKDAKGNVQWGAAKDLLCVTK